MPTHIHLVVGVSGDPPPEKIIGNFKSYGSRTLNLRWGEAAKRKLVERRERFQAKVE